MGVYVRTHNQSIILNFSGAEVSGTHEKDTVMQSDRLCVLCRAAHHLFEKCLFTVYQVNC